MNQGVTMRRLALTDDILMKIEKPARYIGNEVNSVMKDKADVDIRFAMCFPDVYEIQLRNSWDFRNHIFLKSQLFFYLDV